MGKVSDKLAECEKEAGAKRYWLMKSEPDVYGIDHLKKDKTADWDGVRNFQARNMMRYEMKKGDEIIFYHSNAKPPGAAGLASVNKEGYPDPTQFDKKEKYYDATSRKEKPKWYCVEVKYKKHLPRLVALQEIRDNPALKNILVIQRGMRLSVQPLTKGEYEAIVSMANKPAAES